MFPKPGELVRVIGTPPGMLIVHSWKRMDDNIFVSGWLMVQGESEMLWKSDIPYYLYTDDQLGWNFI